MGYQVNLTGQLLSIPGTGTGTRYQVRPFVLLFASPPEHYIHILRLHKHYIKADD